MDTDGSIWRLPALFFQNVSLTAEPSEGGVRGVLGLVVLFLVFVVCGAYFGGAESGFSAMNKIRIKAKAEDGDKRAKNAMFISNNFDRALTTLLIGNNITHIAAASVATLIATRLFGTSNTVTVWCTIITTLIVFLFSEMIPKSFANDRSETMSLFSAGFLRVLMKILSPFAIFFGWISSAFTKLVSKFVKHEEEPSITEEELYDIIETIEEEGVMNEEQGDLLKSALGFSGTQVKDVMTMRSDICAVDAALSNREILTLVRDSTHTRLPVYEKDLDHIIGVLQIRTFMREYLRDPNLNLRTLLIPAFHMPPTAMIDDLLSEMRQHKFYLGVVSDKDGKTLGLVTIEDFLEELVGEIWDEDDVIDENFVKLGGNRSLVTPNLTLSEIMRRFDLPCPVSANSERPLLSLILEHFGKIPEEDESFVYQNLEITIDTVENTKIMKAVVRLLTEEDLAAMANADSTDSAAAESAI